MVHDEYFKIDSWFHETSFNYEDLYSEYFSLDTYPVITDIFQEGQRLNTLGNKIKELGSKIVEWILRAVNWIKEMYHRRFGDQRLKNLGSKINAIERKKKSISIDDIPSEFTEAVINDKIRQIGKLIKTNKSLVISCTVGGSLSLAAIIFGGPVAYAVPVIKGIWTSTEVIKYIIIPHVIPMNKELFKTIKEIQRMKKEVNGKERKVQMADGTQKVVIELPESTYIQINKFRELIDTWCERIINDKSQNFKVNIRSTDDILQMSKKFFKVRAIYDSSSEVNSIERDVLNESQELFRSFQMLNSDPSIAKKLIKLPEISKKRDQVAFTLWILRTMVTHISNLVSIYNQDGVEYTVKGENVVKMISRPAQKYVRSVMGWTRDVNTLQTAVEDSVDFASAALQSEAA